MKWVSRIIFVAGLILIAAAVVGDLGPFILPGSQSDQKEGEYKEFVITVSRVPGALTAGLSLLAAAIVMDLWRPKKKAI